MASVVVDTTNQRYVINTRRVEYVEYGRENGNLNIVFTNSVPIVVHLTDEKAPGVLREFDAAFTADAKVDAVPDVS